MSRITLFRRPTGRSHRPRAVVLAALAVSAALYGAPAGHAQRVRNDSLDRLRYALNEPSPSPDDKAGIEKRQQLLRERIKPLATLGDMSKALLLTDWRIEPRRIGEGSQDDLEVYDEMAKRFQEGARQLMKGGRLGERVAVANLIGEMAVAERKATIAKPELQRRLVELAPAITEMAIDDRRPEVQTAAVMSLANLQAPPADTVKAVAALQRSGNPRVEKAAIDALALYIQTAADRSKKYIGTARAAAGEQIDLTRNLMAGAELVIPPIGQAMRAGQPPEVRRAGAEAARVVAAIMRQTINDATLGTGENLGATLEAVRRPALAFEEQAAVLREALTAPDSVLRLRTVQTLEELADGLRQSRELRRTSGGGGRESPSPRETPPAANGNGTAPPEKLPAPTPPAPPSLKLLLSSLPGLIQALSDPDVRVRRTTVSALEWMGQDARPALSALLRSLSDSDVFVRWATVRTLGALAAGAEDTSPFSAADMDRVVQGLTRLLGGDEDLNARLAVLTALERIGPRAEAAVPVLWATANRGDPTYRINVLRTLQGIGLAAINGPAGAVETDGRMNLPPLARSLSDPDANVRKAASEAVGQFASALKPEDKGSKLYRLVTDPNSDVRLAFIRILEDPDGAVRRAASEALLQVQR